MNQPDWQHSQDVEKEYERGLRKIAKESVRYLKDANDRGIPTDVFQLIAMRYADLIEPWATTLVERIGWKIERQNRAMFNRNAKAMGVQIQKLMEDDKGVGGAVRLWMDGQISLIKSIPLEASQRVHKAAMESLHTGSRASAIEDVLRTQTGVSEGRARLIARTETARAQSTLVMIRAENLGSEEYIWRTAKDYDVRPSHKEMEGKTVRWDHPPTLSDGTTCHAGTIYNCFPGNTLVALDGGIRKVIRAPFNGRVITINTPTATVTATPNHPILTNRGWVAASEICEGDYLMQSLGNAVNSGESDENILHSTFDDLFLAFSENSEASAGVLFDFYGDIPDGNVDVAIVDKQLSGNIMPKIGKAISNFNLPNSNAVMSGIGLNVQHVSGSGVRRKLPSFLEGKFSHSQEIGIASASNGDAFINEPLGNGQSGNSDFLGNRKDAFTAQIIRNTSGNIEIFPINRWLAIAPSLCIDASGPEFLAQYIGAYVDGSGGILEQCAVTHEGLRVVDLFSSEYFGHVYTLETEKGWYGVGSGNIIAKNCRCYPSPILPLRP